MSVSRLILAPIVLALAVASETVAASAPAPAPTVEKTLEQSQENAYRDLGWQVKRYRQADLDAWVKHYQEDMVLRLTGRPGSTPEGDAQRLAEIPRVMEELRAAGLLRLPTPYEDPRTYLEMAILAHQIEQGTTRSFGRRLFPRIVFGTLPTGQIQASAKPVDGGGAYLVTFESGLFPFADIFSVIVVQALPPAGRDGAWFTVSLDRDAIRHHLDANPAIVASLADAVKAYFLGGAPQLEALRDRGRLEEPYKSLAEMQYRSMLLFALAHEYGHVVALDRHLDPDRTLPPGWGPEIAADGWGVMFSMLATGGGQRDVATSLWGMKFFLATFDLLERSQATLALGTETGPAGHDHPPTDVRLRYLPNDIRVVSRLFSGGPLPTTPAELEAALHEAGKLDAITEVLWERLRPVLVSLHAAGARPAPVWQKPR